MKIYNQNDYPNTFLGFSKKRTIKSDGCLLTCITSIYQEVTGKKITPPEMNEKLKKNGCFLVASLIFPKVCEVLGWKYIEKQQNIVETPEKKGIFTPTIKEVDYSYRQGSQQHFVVRIYDKKGNYILDPLEGVRRSINFYEKKVGDTAWKTKYFSYRIFKV